MPKLQMRPKALLVKYLTVNKVRNIKVGRAREVQALGATQARLVFAVMT